MSICPYLLEFSANEQRSLITLTCNRKINDADAKDALALSDSRSQTSTSLTHQARYYLQTGIFSATSSRASPLLFYSPVSSPNWAPFVRHHDWTSMMSATQSAGGVNSHGVLRFTIIDSLSVKEWACGASHARLVGSCE